MHNDAYSTVRDFLLANCTTWLQDDTAIPVRFLKNNKYALTLYGNYVRPIPLFASRHQPDLYQLYQSDSSRKELPYSMGYHGPTSPANLQLIRHK
jgi:hypothetical protein